MAQQMKIVIGFILLVLLLTLHFVSLFGREWLTLNDDHAGLWEKCTESGCKWMTKTPSFDGSHRSCRPVLTYNIIALSIAVPPSHMFYLAFATSNNLLITRANFEDHIITFVPFLDWYAAVRAFLVLTCIFNGMEIFLLNLHMCDPTHFKLKPVRICLVFTNMFLFVGLIVFGMEKKNIFDEEWSLGWTYHITIFDLILTFLTTIYFLFLHDSDKPSKSIFSQKNQSMQPVMTTQYKRNTQAERVVVPASFMDNQSEKERIEIPKSFRPTEQLRNTLLMGGKNESSDRKSFLKDDESEDESYTVDSYSSTEEETASEATGFV